MLRNAGLFLALPGLRRAGSPGASAASLSSPPGRSRLVHRHPPTAGNYVPGYRHYRSHRRARGGFFGALAGLLRGHGSGRRGGVRTTPAGRMHCTP